MEQIISIYTGPGKGLMRKVLSEGVWAVDPIIPYYYHSVALPGTANLEVVLFSFAVPKSKNQNLAHLLNDLIILSMDDFPNNSWIIHNSAAVSGQI